MRPTDFGHRYMDRADHSGWWMFIGTLLVVALWSLLIWLLLSAFRRSGGSPDQSLQQGRQTGSSTPTGPEASPTASAEQILAERFARGEIDPDEYHQRLDALRSS